MTPGSFHESVHSTDFTARLRNKGVPVIDADHPKSIQRTDLPDVLRTNVMVFSKAAAKVFGLRGCGRVSIYLPLS